MRILNYVLYVSACLMAGTGLLLAYRLPPGSEGVHGLRFFGMDRHDWADVHFWLSFSFFGLLVAHLAANWSWLKKIATGERVWRLAIGLCVGVAVILFFLLTPVTHLGANEDGAVRWGQH